MKNLEITKERILSAASQHPEAKDILESLFPEAFEDNRVFCKIGSLLIRSTNPKNVYAVFKWNGEVRLLSITNNSFWKTEGERNLLVSRLADPLGETITVGEFGRRLGSRSVSDFSLVDMERIKIV